MKKIAVAGATGFVGKHLLDSLLKNTDHTIKALSRSEYQSPNPRLTYHRADLFSLLDLESALEGCDTAVYLVHSMVPSSRLSQGSFRDFDFLLADNFARACEIKGIKQIIYLGGIISKDEELSEHLSSRLEVEEVLASRSASCLSIRCSLIIGPNGSSFKILEKLVHRLPVLFFPSWCESRIQPIFIDDVVATFIRAINCDKPLTGYLDLGVDESLSYLDLIKRTARIMKKKRFFFKIPIIPLYLSKLWIRLITGTRAELVYPLIDSLVHNMLIDDKRSDLTNVQLDPKSFHSIDESLKSALTMNSSDELSSIRNTRKINSDRPQIRVSEVRSVQRLPFSSIFSAQWAGEAYLKWLPKILSFFLTAKTSNLMCSFHFKGIRYPLLTLKFSKERSCDSRAIFYVKEGLLVSRKMEKSGRLEFRESPNKEFLISAIHNFVPALPWYIYRFTQAIIHKYIMIQFGKYISKEINSNTPRGN